MEESAPKRAVLETIDAKHAALAAEDRRAFLKPSPRQGNLRRHGLNRHGHGEIARPSPCVLALRHGV
jgi:hypothetical protein